MELLYKKGCSEKFRYIHKKTPLLEFLFNKFAGPQACFPANITKFLRTPISKISANGCFCVTLLFFLPSFSIFIQNYYFMFSFPYDVTYFAKYLLITKFKEVCNYIKYNSIYMYREYWK